MHTHVVTGVADLLKAAKMSSHCSRRDEVQYSVVCCYGRVPVV